MNVEAEMLIAILKLTRDGPVTQETINKHARIPAEVSRKLLQTLRKEGLIYVYDNVLEASESQRLEIAVQALRLGADVERVSDFLQWKEFEAMAAVALENNGYVVQRNVRFKHQGRRWEIDVVGYRKPLAVCIDCKHWHHRLCKSTMDKIVSEQTARTTALAKSLPNPTIKIAAPSLRAVKFIPIILSLIVGQTRFHKSVPIVPILQMQDFLKHLPTCTDSLLCIGSEDVRLPISQQKKIADKRFSLFESP